MLPIEWLQILFAASSVLAAGALMAAQQLEWRGAPERGAFCPAAAALLLLAAAAVFLALQMGRPERLLAALNKPNTPLFFEAAGIAAAFFAAAAYCAALWKGTEWKTCKALAAAAALFAVIVPAALGASFVMPWRAAWNTPFVALPILGFSFLAGAEIFASAKLFFEPESEAGKLSRTTLACAVLSLFCLGSYLSALAASGNSEAHDAFAAALAGEPAILFWPAVILAYLPAAALICALAKNTVSTTGSRGSRKILALASLAAALSAGASAALIRVLIGALGLAAWSFFAR